MQTTLRLNDELYRRAKAEAARQGITLTRLIEEGIRLRLAQTPRSPKEIKLHTYSSGVPFDLTPEEIKRLIHETDIQPPKDLLP
ncbi:hypothetical protein E5F05_19220 [Deinococcus metallilatus]|uniref:Uncharacterized protein n=1 Tax=Deinococcus metallilatus TaxID=1211322 RepID=A0AAJ5K4D0_9DEIO|nr:hypothetical protein [Deinococcus metallilatus]MBB5296449.1 hypothetical protein [Deinococcus metallilatus]QBY09882.1 hypothetical protein E5F05_19220 [Deinococcus metallilatus]RXJ08606.1 hypothetical protein ERJ73_18060 [Deinococcus metallilatus]TLK25080.1 hypothetical protein FCS05_12975 [Deinococcus metallilatus]GMA14638.1 hypothetical protein GCM10025871_09690 [Deinococcus metallilatus]